MGTRGQANTENAESMTIRIVEEVAEREDVDPLELSPPLHDAFDPEAAESLITEPMADDGRDDIELTFRYLGYEIIVDGDGVHM